VIQKYYIFTLNLTSDILTYSVTLVSYKGTDILAIWSTICEIMALE